MPSPFVNQLQVEDNKRRQQILKAAGYNVTVDGSWGPYQESLWNKVNAVEAARKRESIRQRVQNMNEAVTTPAVAVKPTSGAGALGGAVTLYALSQDPRVQQFYSNIVVPTAVTASGNLVGFTGDVLDRVGRIFRADEAAPATAAVNPDAAPNDTTHTGTGNTTPPPSEDPNKKKSLRERLGDAIAGRNTPKTPSVDKGWDFGVSPWIKHHPYLTGIGLSGVGYGVYKANQSEKPKQPVAQPASQQYNQEVSQPVKKPVTPNINGNSIVGLSQAADTIQ